MSLSVGDGVAVAAVAWLLQQVLRSWTIRRATKHIVAAVAGALSKQ